MEITVQKHNDTIDPQLKNIPDWIEINVSETNPSYIDKVVIDKTITFTLLKELHEYKCSWERKLSTDAYYILEFIVDYLEDLVEESSYIISDKKYFITPWTLIKYPKTKRKTFLHLQDTKSHQYLLNDLKMSKLEFIEKTEQYLNTNLLELQEIVEKERKLKINN